MSANFYLHMLYSVFSSGRQGKGNFYLCLAKLVQIKWKLWHTPYKFIMCKNVNFLRQILISGNAVSQFFSHLIRRISVIPVRRLATCHTTNITSRNGVLISQGPVHLCMCVDEIHRLTIIVSGPRMRWRSPYLLFQQEKIWNILRDLGDIPSPKLN